MSNRHQEPVAAVMATFRPDESVLENVARVLTQVDRLVAVDDGSGSGSIDLLEQIEAHDPERITVLRLEENGGIAAALNLGIQTALGGGASAVLTLDQDTLLDPDYVNHALTALSTLEQQSKAVAAVAAGVQSGTSVRPVHHQDRGDRITPTLEAIQSGLLIPAAVLRRLGGFDESLFIDCVDSDFVLRAAQVGLHTYLVRGCSIDHPLGRTIDVPGVRTSRSGRKGFAFHPPWRRYYISRNRVRLLLRHGGHEPGWAVVSSVGELVQLLRCLAFGPDKRRQGLAVVLGLIDALRGRSGRIPVRTAAALGVLP